MSISQKILLIHTGGTIGSVQSTEQGAREQSARTVELAKRDLLLAFEKGSAYASCVEIVDGQFPSRATTLSESMTMGKLCQIICHIRDAVKGGGYKGIVVLHGTDTLAYTAALFSFIFANIRIPTVLVSGNRPPRDPLSNASVNFISAIELICEGLAPNVYATYRNSDGRLRLYLASTLMQSPCFSEDFFSGSDRGVFDLGDTDRGEIMAACREYSLRRACHPKIDISKLTDNFARVLLIHPYTGLDYSLYEQGIAGGGYGGVVHGAYHSGTVALPGLVLLKEAEETSGSEAGDLRCMAEAQISSSVSVCYLWKLCQKADIPLYIAPSALGSDQYETMNAVGARTGATLLSMTTEAAYAKLTVALTFGLSGSELHRYMTTEVNNELIK